MINYPTSLDSLTNPTTSSPLNSPSHAGQHSDANDAIEALQAKVGADSSAVTTSHDYKLSDVTTGNKAESSANKETSALDTSTTKYPCNNVVKSAVDGKVSLTDILNSQSTASASSITPTGNYKENEYYVTALAADLTINAPSGIASNGNTLMIRIKDDETSRTLTFNEAFVAVGVTLPPATTINKVIYIGAIYNSTSSKWEVVSINEE